MAAREEQQRILHEFNSEKMREIRFQLSCHSFVQSERTGAVPLGVQGLAESFQVHFKCFCPGSFLMDGCLIFLESNGATIKEL